MKNTNRKNAIFTEFSTAGTIPREILKKRMRDCSARKNIFITAPGGYGKTVAAAQWLSGFRGTKGRMVITDADNNPTVFYKRLSGALSELTGHEVKGDSLGGLLAAVQTLPKGKNAVYFVIDDLHILKNEIINNALPLIITYMPAYIRLCLVSRLEPPADLLQTGRFEVLTKDAFIFTPNDIEMLCAEKERDLSDGQIRDMLETTGGWAIYISALLSADTNAEDKMPQTLNRYLETKVWESWDDEIKLLILQLSVVSEITPELAAALTGQADGQGVIDRLLRCDNTFLSYSNVASLSDNGAYHFHDIFRDFLLERAKVFLSKDETRRLNAAAAEWYFGRGAFFQSIRHFYANRDHEGIIRCYRANTVYDEKTERASVEAIYHFADQNIQYMPMSFVAENPFLIEECAYSAFLDGNADEFLHYKTLLMQKLPEIAKRYPDLAETAFFLNSLDYRVPMLKYAGQLADMTPLMGAAETGAAARSSTITQNLPFFHRSMRDLSEVYELKTEDLRLLRDTFGVMIGGDYAIMEQAMTAGLYYERGELLQAAHHALTGFLSCACDTHPETVFCARMILAAILYAIGGAREADGIMEQTEAYIGRAAKYLYPNFKALKTERAIRAGDTEAAREWLDIYTNRADILPFYQIVRHFTTLRALFAVEKYELAAILGKRLTSLSTEYNRPLDIIESVLLTAIALWKNGLENEAASQLQMALGAAIPYGFTQIFINEAAELLPILWKLREENNKPSEITRFADDLTGEICKKHGLIKGDAPKLSPQQRAMLPYLNKGMSYGEIAEAAKLGVDSIKAHVRLLYKKLGVHSAREAVIKAKMLGLIE